MTDDAKRLADKWDVEQSEYPDTPEGRYAAAAVRLCAKELRAALRAQRGMEPAIRPTHEAADAFWNYWKANGETHKHGYYESTWGAINAALRTSGIVRVPIKKGPR